MGVRRGRRRETQEFVAFVVFAVVAAAAAAAAVVVGSAKACIESLMTYTGQLKIKNALKLKPCTADGSKTSCKGSAEVALCCASVRWQHVEIATMSSKIASYDRKPFCALTPA